MGKIELKRKTEREHKEYDPIVLSDNVVITVTRDINAGAITVEGEAYQGEKRLCRFMWSEQQKRILFNFETDGVKRNTLRELMDALTQVCLELVTPEEDNIASEIFYIGLLSGYERGKDLPISEDLLSATLDKLEKEDKEKYLN